MRFEVWLLGNTIPIQKSYWSLLKEAKWNKDKAAMPQYSILEAVIVEKPDFNDLDLLFQEIYANMTKVTDEVMVLLKNT